MVKKLSKRVWVRCDKCSNRATMVIDLGAFKVHLCPKHTAALFDKLSMRMAKAEEE